MPQTAISRPNRNRRTALNKIFNLNSHAQDIASGLDSLGKGVQHRDGVIPVDAGIGNAHAVLQARLTLLRDLLVAYMILVYVRRLRVGWWEAYPR